ncbi:MAG: NAD+ synthase [Chitinivibrionia bacterium]|nr:NAD+ synthase [Chitinivibrionia bacterium]
MLISLMQLNPIVGDIEGNVSRAIELLRKVSKDHPDLIVFPELSITGYPPKDLLERPDFIEEAADGLQKLAAVSASYPSIGIIAGVPLLNNRADGKGIHNAAALIHNGEVVFKQAKSLLPTYDVFDEARYFDPAQDIDVVSFKGETLGITICEDAWNDPDFYARRPYSTDPVATPAGKGATLFINISASPFSAGKERVRFELLSHQARKHRLPIAVVNQVGGNDDLIFDGRSLFIDERGDAQLVLPAFEETAATFDTAARRAPSPYPYAEEVESIYKALVLGTRDYVRKCGFERVILGLSGGIDSAVTCAVAADAVGAEHVLALAMPSPYSSEASMRDAELLARNCGVELTVVPIPDIMRAYEDALADHFKGVEPDVTEENIQARIRGNILMAFANKFGFLPLSTGNKSELAVGYCTLYGDMSGGLAVISDVPKTLVYKLAEHINKDGEVIPGNTIKKPPSAELKANQVDQDTLPPYEILDAILARYIDQGGSSEDIVAAGFDRETVRWTIDAVRRNEYKRKQSPPGLKVTSKAFGSGRRLPIAARYKV